MTLYIFPNTLGNRRVDLLPAGISEVLPKLQGLIAESDRGGRTFLSLWKVQEIHKFPIAVLSKNARSVKAWDFYLEPIVKKQENWGLVSDSGLPCIADPGAGLVRRARDLNLPIQAFSGPCSITLALMLSGLPGQNFTFLGYLPQNPRERERCVKSSAGKQHTQICIETPYRNVHTFQALLEVLPGHADLCVGIDLTGDQEFVSTRSVGTWLQSKDIDQVTQKITKTPAIFLFHTPR
ncbi:tetrapyrrole (Corrin/Porphyrin) Methylases family protein [Chlamydia psittaci GR9]|uniref:SAM-dependent methyltransferase n=1 Tax=Chlamydophila parapsittaci TaxID=344886 RepID=A0ABX5W182_9CHLA|nr:MULTISPECIES: SAM-dependent methyltransferase [Chlamydia]EPJ32340.1 tetrapyrrole (Corrin/Porphyrin) Methylases family protein [Chlamydia psittaci 06-1683]AFS20542.1 tetrapyrrole (Corrin/Porphyrin) Methylases family protein [Chlamydia psittaci GR9]AFS23748.1 tetrapyrrole (Corrin/Porphyrin) Methylases family protein [Chlamydia psittaci WS/RT/E30]QDE37594.1 SAM-dependent methyltransferase [Chlamydophila parapsittaci]QHE19252.1 SAM-dependent methyltransferase [Chlamydia psittaci]